MDTEYHDEGDDVNAVEEYRKWCVDADRDGYGRSVPREMVDAALAELEASWDGLRREVMAYEKSGIDLYERANGKAFRKMMDRWAERSTP